LNGYNGTIFAYGQTGSGKTWSMTGGDGELRGIIPRMNVSLFDLIEQEKSKRSSLLFLVTLSYFELYNENINDLLDTKAKKSAAAKGGLEIKEHPVLGVYVKGLQEIVVDSASKMQEIMDTGIRNRTVAATQMNADSSRSHSIFMIKIHQRDTEDESKSVFAKINLVDLAGSERAKSTGATGSTLKEGANINKSLSALGNVINALVEQAKGKKGVFIPYRNSKLTRVLQESLGGNSVTFMLAALSPAACNFEETLSTLKYANRAKDIKVNAVKNEEASQISKLNDEIRLLREKLAGQASAGNVSSFDTSALEERHRQQLKELEAATKNTWAVKEKLSAEYEIDKRRLEMEQRAAARQLEAERERNWKLIEDKSDIEMSLGHVKDINRSDLDFTSIISDWLILYRNDILKLDQCLSEQEMVVQVYRTALERDGKQLMKGQVTTLSSPSKFSSSSNFSTFDKTTVSLWRQFRDKFGSTFEEVHKLTDTQNNHIDTLQQFSTKVQSFLSIRQSDEKEKTEDVIRGLQMIERQLKKKILGCKKNTLLSREKIVVGLGTMVDDLLNSLDLYQKTINQISSQEESKGELSLEPLVQKLQNFMSILKDIKIEKSSTEVKSDPATEGSNDYLKANQKIELLTSFLVETSPAWTFSGKANLDEEVMWSYLSNDAFDQNTFLEVVLNSCHNVTGVTLQGGTALKYLKNGRSNSSSNVVSLPCGLTSDHLNGDINTTINALGDVIDWTALLKKQPPQNLLQRPPVRFLFDLFKFIMKSEPGWFPSDLETVSWEEVNVGKESKVQFMDKVLEFIGSYLNTKPATNSNSIITGQDVDKTLMFLQQIAIAMHMYHQKIEPQTDPMKSSREPEQEKTSTWPLTVKVSLSSDGYQWYDEDHEVALQNSNEKIQVHLRNGIVESKFIRVYPLRWYKTDDQECTNCPAIRIGINAIEKNSDHISEASDSNQSADVIDSNEVLKSLSTLRDAADLIAIATEELVRFDDMLKLKQKEKAYKKMEDLSSEKLAFDDLLVNEKQDLADQLKKTLQQLREMESLYEKERLMKEELENNNIQLEAEKQMNVLSLQDEIVDLKNDMLKLQANYEKDRFLINTMEVKLREQTETVGILNTEVDENQRKRTQLEAELEDLTNQNVVLLEERDSAQANEEDYFRKLNDITIDLERLQESYVIMTDRCNDQSDEIADLRDKVMNLEELLEKGAVSNYFSSNTPNRPNTSSSYQRPTTSNSRLPPPTPESNLYFDDVFVDEPIKKEKSHNHRLAITNENKKVNEQENSAYDDDFDDYDNDDFES